MRAVRRPLSFIAILFVLLSASSCSSYDKVKKSSDVNLKLTTANQYYDASSCTRSAW